MHTYQKKIFYVLVLYILNELHSLVLSIVMLRKFVFCFYFHFLISFFLFYIMFFFFFKEKVMIVEAQIYIYIFLKYSDQICS